MQNMCLPQLQEQTPLMAACWGGLKDAAAALLEVGAKVTATDAQVHVYCLPVLELQSGMSTAYTGPYQAA